MHKFGYMSEVELSRLGSREAGYVRVLTQSEARRLMPEVTFPDVEKIYLLSTADGTPVAVSDTIQSIVGTAEESELALHPLN